MTVTDSGDWRLMVILTMVIDFKLLDPLLVLCQSFFEKFSFFNGKNEVLSTGFLEEHFDNYSQNLEAIHQTIHINSPNRKELLNYLIILTISDLSDFELIDFVLLSRSIQLYQI